MFSEVMSTQEKWDECLDSCVFKYNTSTGLSGCSPFETMFRRKAGTSEDLKQMEANDE